METIVILGQIKITLAAIVMFVLFWLAVGAVFGLLFYLIDYVAGKGLVKEPFPTWIKVALMILLILLIINEILSWIGSPMVVWH